MIDHPFDVIKRIVDHKNEWKEKAEVVWRELQKPLRANLSLKKGLFQLFPLWRSKNHFVISTEGEIFL